MGTQAVKPKKCTLLAGEIAGQNLLALLLLPNLKLCTKETTKQSLFKVNLNRGMGLVWLSLLLSKVPQKRGYYFSVEISYAELHLQKIIK